MNTSFVLVGTEAPGNPVGNTDQLFVSNQLPVVPCPIQYRLFAAAPRSQFLLLPLSMLLVAAKFPWLDDASESSMSMLLSTRGLVGVMFKNQDEFVTEDRSVTPCS